MNAWETVTIIAGGIATLAIFSFLIKENPFYRFFEHIFIGLAAGFVPILSIKNVLWPKVLQPMLGLDQVVYPDGTVAEPYNPWALLYLLPMLFGLLYYALYSKRFSWLVKLVIGFSLGVSGGLAFKGFFAEMLPQVIGSFKPLLVLVEGATGQTVDWFASLSNIFFVFTLLTVMYYFFFTFRSEAQVVRRIGDSGRWLMMICFGAFFGSTVMARMALLVERLQFLLNDWWQAVWGLLL